MPFRMGFIDQSNTNYEVWLDEDSELSNWQLSEITGFAGDAPVNQNSVPRIQFHAGDAKILTDRMTTCNYAGDDCYLAKSVGVIDKIFYEDGYKNGGQYLKFEGTRLAGLTTTSIEVAGVSCTPVDGQVTKESSVCITGSTAAASTAGTYIGQHGLRREKFLSNNNIDVNNIRNLAVSSQEVLLSGEFPSETDENGQKQASIISGVFQPPVNGDYEFIIGCDDFCVLKLESTGIVTNKDTLTTIIESYAYSEKDYYYEDGRDDLKSSALTLTQGMSYYFELHQASNSGGSYAQLGVTINSNPSATHKQVQRESQILKMNKNNAVYYKMRIVITNPDSSNEFSLYFYDPVKEQPYVDVRTINGFPTANQCKNGVSQFIWNTYYTWVDAERFVY